MKKKEKEAFVEAFKSTFHHTLILYILFLVMAVFFMKSAQESTVISRLISMPTLGLFMSFLLASLILKTRVVYRFLVGWFEPKVFLILVPLLGIASFNQFFSDATFPELTVFEALLIVLFSLIITRQKIIEISFKEIL